MEYRVSSSCHTCGWLPVHNPILVPVYSETCLCFVWPGPLITQIFVVAPPSTEKFLLQLENCVPGYEKSEGKQEEDSDSDDEDAEEEKASGKQ